MSGIEKQTTMRRMALITPGGNIVWEGVNIEGDVVLKEVNYSKIATIKQSNVDDFARKRDLVVKYQDPASEDFWEPCNA